MTPDELSAIRARLDAATGIEWRYHADLGWLSAESPSGEIYTIASLSLDSTTDGMCYGAARNGPFIAHARTDVGALLDEVERLHSGSVEAPGIPEHLRLNMAKVRDAIGAVSSERDTALAEGARLEARVTELEPIMRCPECGGDGELTFDVVRRGTEHDTETAECRACNGTGICQDMIAEVARLKMELIAQTTPSEQAGRVAVAEDAVIAAAERLVEEYERWKSDRKRQSTMGNPPGNDQHYRHRDFVYFSNVRSSVHALRAARAGKGG